MTQGGNALSGQCQVSEGALCSDSRWLKSQKGLPGPPQGNILQNGENVKQIFEIGGTLPTSGFWQRAGNPGSSDGTKCEEVSKKPGVFLTLPCKSEMAC